MGTPSLFANESLQPRTDSSRQSLCEKYRPRRIADFVGLEKAKKILQQFAAQPHRAAWLFSGPTGIGKTSMALALASELAAEVHHLAPTCTRGDIDRVWAECQGFPAAGYKAHLILVDDVDAVSKSAIATFLAKLDARSVAPGTVWVFTCRDAEKLDRRFRSFCLKIKFSSEGIAKQAAELLKHIWEAERGPGDPTPPNFARIVKESNNDIRAALVSLEMIMMTNKRLEPIA